MPDLLPENSEIWVAFQLKTVKLHTNAGSKSIQMAMKVREAPFKERKKGVPAQLLKLHHLKQGIVRARSEIEDGAEGRPFKRRRLNDTVEDNSVRQISHLYRNCLCCSNEDDGRDESDARRAEHSSLSIQEAHSGLTSDCTTLLARTCPSTKT